jgi:hypothetical protein
VRSVIWISAAIARVVGTEVITWLDNQHSVTHTPLETERRAATPVGPVGGRASISGASRRGFSPGGVGVDPLKATVSRDHGSVKPNRSQGSALFGC